MCRTRRRRGRCASCGRWPRRRSAGADKRSVSRPRPRVSRSSRPTTRACAGGRVAIARARVRTHRPPCVVPAHEEHALHRLALLGRHRPARAARRRPPRSPRPPRALPLTPTHPRNGRRTPQLLSRGAWEARGVPRPCPHRAIARRRRAPAAPFGRTAACFLIWRYHARAPMRFDLVTNIVTKIPFICHVCVRACAEMQTNERLSNSHWVRV